MDFDIDFYGYDLNESFSINIPGFDVFMNEAKSEMLEGYTDTLDALKSIKDMEGNEGIKAVQALLHGLIFTYIKEDKATKNYLFVNRWLEEDEVYEPLKVLLDRFKSILKDHEIKLETLFENSYDYKRYVSEIKMCLEKFDGYTKTYPCAEYFFDHLDEILNMFNANIYGDARSKFYETIQWKVRMIKENWSRNYNPKTDPRSDKYDAAQEDRLAHRANMRALRFKGNNSADARAQINNLY